MKHLARLAMLAGLAAFLAVPAARAQSGDDAALYRGLEQWGLKGLQDVFVRKYGEPASTPAGQPTPAAGVSAEGAAADAEGLVQRAQNADADARDALYEQALGLYRAAIRDAEQRYENTPDSQWQDRVDAHMAAIKLRVSIGDMIFVIPKNWMEAPLQTLELTNRSVGSREQMARLAGIALDAYTEALQEIATWMSEIDRDPDRPRYVNAGIVGDLQRMMRSAEFYAGWVGFYRGWLLPKDYAPEGDEKPRDVILNDAITRLMGFTTLPEDAPARNWAWLVIGQAFRELGQTEDSLNAFAQIRDNKETEDLSIRREYEKALTYLKAERYKDAIKAIESAQGLWGENRLKQTLYGLGMPLVMARAQVLLGQAEKDEAVRQKGIEALKGLYDRGGPWPAIVAGEMARLGIDEGADEDPLALWMRIQSTLEKARDPANKAEAEDLFRQAAGQIDTYLAKVGKEHENYTMALYTKAATLYQLGEKAAAAQAFRQVAEQFPDFQYAGQAAQYCVALRGQVFDAAKGTADEEAARDAYEQTLTWFVARYLDQDPMQLYYLGQVQYGGGKYQEAVQTFRRVPSDSDVYADAQYWIALATLEQFRESTLTSNDKTIILARAPSVAKELEQFGEFALDRAGKAQDPKRKADLESWALAAYFSASELFLYPEVGLPKDANQVASEIEKKFGSQLDESMRGRLLRIQIDALRQMGQLTAAGQKLESYLSIMQSTGRESEIGGVLGGLFQANYDDVKQTLKRDAEAAKAKVGEAQNLADRLIVWLQEKGGPDKAAQIETIRYDLAELYLAVGEYNTALGLYQQINGGPRFSIEEEIKLDALLGAARCYEGLGDTAPDSGAAKPNYEQAADLWEIALDVASAGRGADPGVVWERRYHLYRCMLLAGQTSEVARSLHALWVMHASNVSDPFGGRDPATRQKLMELRDRSGATALATKAAG